MHINNLKVYYFISEINYSRLKNLNKNELYQLSKNSLIRQILKKEEVVKHFNLKKNSELSEKLLKENYTAQGLENKEKYSNFLMKEGFNIEILKEKLLIERLWNSLIYDKFKNKIVLSRNGKIKLFDENIEKYSSNIPFGSKLKIDDGDKVNSNQILAEWDPYTLPIIAERNGYVKYIDLKQKNLLIYNY